MVEEPHEFTDRSVSDGYGSICTHCGSYIGRADGCQCEEEEEQDYEEDDDDDGEDICDVCGEDSSDCECTEQELEEGRVIW